MAFYSIVLRMRSERAREALLGQLSDGWGEDHMDFRITSNGDTVVIADVEWVDTGRNCIDTYGKALADE